VRGQCELRIERNIYSEAVNFKHTSGRCCVGRAANRSDPGDFQIDFERIYRQTLQPDAVHTTRAKQIFGQANGESPIAIPSVNCSDSP
jgi:hypothetical protein